MLVTQRVSLFIKFNYLQYFDIDLPRKYKILVISLYISLPFYFRNLTFINNDSAHKKVCIKDDK